MRHLNYNHLQYFWAVAREGSIAKASESLHLTPQTISGQLKLLDDAVGQPLFNRVGRRLVLSEMGRVVYEYANEIFSVGAELASVVRGWLGYYSVPGNFRCLDQFITEVTKLWLRQIRRRSQRGRSRWTWERMDRLSKKHLPRARIGHPYPGIRFHARLGAGAV